VRFKSLWNGPTVFDRVACKLPGGIEAQTTWCSVGLYALDHEDRAWTYCQHLGTNKGKWILFEDLMSGAAGRQAAREEAA
jgi:hypothetical protein